MPLPLILAAGASLFEIGSGVYNMYQGRRQERDARRREDEYQRQLAERNQQMLDLAREQDRRDQFLQEQERLRYDRLYGRVQDELSDLYSGTEGGAGKLSRVNAEQRIAAGTLRSLEGDTRRTEQNVRTAVGQSLASRGLRGAAASGTLAELETDLASRRAEIAAGAVEGARRERAAFAFAEPRPRETVPSRELSVLAGTGPERFQIPSATVDASGIVSGADSLALLAGGEDFQKLWDAMKRKKRPKMRDGEADYGGYS